MFQAAILPEALPSSARMPVLQAGRGADDEHRSIPGFVVGLVLEDAGIAISFPAIDAEASSDELQLLSKVETLLPQALDIFTVHSASPDLGTFFGRLRAETLHAGFMILDLRDEGDPALDPLAAALVAALPDDATTASIYANAIGAVIAARFTRESRPATAGKRRSCGLLPKWRMKRVLDYIETHLDETVTLADLSAAAKLTRMHFAAQFRASTGLRPHEYLLRQRIERAKALLAEGELSIVEVALSVGFQTQAHFTTVFGRFVGSTPYQWRRAQAAERKPEPAPRRTRSSFDGRLVSAGQALGHC